jgi:D-alanyl-D-alanine carboxypeptidase
MSNFYQIPTNMETFLLIVLLSFMSFITSYSQNLADSITNYAVKNNFNGSILINQGDSIIYSYSSGYANMEFDVENQDSTKFKIASVTKLFTSVLIMQLSEKGNLNLDDKIENHLPLYNGEGAGKVTIRDLLTATSGLEDMEKNGDEVYERRLTTDTILIEYCSGKLVNKPGTQFYYNNADFVILGKIIESIYKKTFAEVLEQQILKPLNLNNTGLLQYEVVKGLADSYMYNEKTKTIERDIPYYPENYFSAGGMYSSTFDLMKFSNSLFSGKILSTESLDVLLSVNLEAYACGLWVFNYWINDSIQPKVAFRPGNIWATEALLIRLLEKDINIIILSNYSEIEDTRDLHYKIIKNLYNEK